MARKNVTYRKYKGPQQGAPMWRDPAQAGGGCAVVVLGIFGVLSAVVTAVV